MTKEQRVTIETETNNKTHERQLREASNFLALWRLCGNAKCRRARCCRGRALLCGRRNSKSIPPSVREFFIAFLAAKRYGLPVEEFREDMEFRPCTRGYFAWRNGAEVKRR